MRSKSIKMVFVARIIRHTLCMISAFFDFFVQKLFSYCWDKFDYPVSIVYLSCSIAKDIFLLLSNLSSCQNGVIFLPTRKGFDFTSVKMIYNFQKKAQFNCFRSIFQLCMAKLEKYKNFKKNYYLTTFNSFSTKT